MSWIFNKFFHIYRIITKIIFSFTFSSIICIFQFFKFTNKPNTFSTASSTGFYHKWKTNFPSFHHGIFIRGYHTVTTWYYWNSSTLHNIPGPRLIAHYAHCFTARTNKFNITLFTYRCKFSIFRQKSKPWVNCIAFCSYCCTNYINFI